jgi:hypothetical protein
MTPKTIKLYQRVALTRESEAEGEKIMVATNLR